MNYIGSSGQVVFRTYRGMADVILDTTDDILAAFLALPSVPGIRELQGDAKDGRKAVRELRDEADDLYASYSSALELTIDNQLAMQSIADVERALEALGMNVDRIPSAIMDAAPSGMASMTPSPASAGMPAPAAGGTSAGEGVAAQEGVPAALLGLTRAVPAAALSGAGPARALTPTPATVSGQPSPAAPQVLISGVTITTAANLTDHAMAAAAGRELTNEIERAMAEARGLRGLS